MTWKGSSNRIRGMLLEITMKNQVVGRFGVIQVVDSTIDAVSSDKFQTLKLWSGVALLWDNKLSRLKDT